MLTKLLSDKLFIAAFLAAIIFWLGFHLLGPSVGSSLFSFSPFILGVLVYPVLEEAAFRGWLQGKILDHKVGRKSYCQISLANLLTSLLFVVIHLFHHNLLWAMAVIVPSLVFGFFRERYQSILPGCLLHIWYNSGYYWAYGFS